MSLMKIGGKSPSNTAVAVAVDADGNVKTKHIWETQSVTLLNEAISDATAHYAPEGVTNIDVSDFALISIFIRNNADKPVSILLTNSGSYLLQPGGIRNEIIVNASDGVIITSDDFPCLNVIPDFQIRYKYSEAPTNSGKLLIRVYKKR